MSEDVKESKIKVEDDGEQITITYTIEKQEFVGKKMERIISEIESSIVRSLAKRIEDQVFNDVMNKVDAAAIANATTVRIIQSMADQNKGNSY